MSDTTEHATGDTCAPCAAILGSPSACAISHDFRPGAYGDPVAALAAEIAARFGETGERPRAQLARMIGLMGAEWVDFVAVEAEMYLGFETLGQNFTRQGMSRTSGGSFFATAKHFGNAALASGRITRRDFFRCFTDRAPAPKVPPVKAPKLPRMPRGASVTAGNVRRQPARVVVPEVYVVRGRAGAGR